LQSQGCCFAALHKNEVAARGLWPISILVQKDNRAISDICFFEDTVGILTGQGNTIMNRIILKSKIHRATVTDLNLDYEGSITIDEELLEKADILPGEQVHVLNVDNGERFVTYAIAAPRGSGTVLLNGPAARRGMTGDKIIIISYCQVPDEKAKGLKAKVVLVDDENKPKQ